MNKDDIRKPAASPVMRPVYSTNEDLMCGVIDYNNRTYLVDLKDKDKLINSNKHFVFANADDIYPSYSCNYKKYNYLDFLFAFDPNKSCYVFANGNHFDLRKCNVKIYHAFHAQIAKQYNVIAYIPGHYLSMGQDANIMKNPMWKIMENGKEYILMYCERDTICKLCPESYQNILEFETTFNNNKKLTWYKATNGYIQTHTCEQKGYFIHQIIMNCYGNGKGTNIISIDHIDRNPLNNSLENLRTATRKEQEQNSKGIAPGTKRERKQNAQTLPDGITHDMMRKYVCYCKDYANKEKTILREYFRVETHPKLDKLWSSTKSNKVSLQEKLQQANKVVDDLEHDIYPDKTEPTLPKYVSLIISREKPHLVFEKRTDDMRLNVKMVLPQDYDLHEQLAILNDKISTKYAGECIL
jgi:hypothetical protein